MKGRRVSQVDRVERVDQERNHNPPRKSTARLLWALFSLFVVYGTTFPFTFSINARNWLDAPRRVNWLVMGGRPGDPIISDIVQNILLFIPFGFLGYFSLIYKSSLRKKIAIVAAGTALSASVEFLQAFSSSRWPALSDVVFNTLGTAVGLVAAMILKKSVLGFKSHPLARRFLDAESAFPALIFLILTVMGCWEPFDFALDVSSIWGDIKPLLHDPFRMANPSDDMISYIRFLLTTLFVCRLAGEAGLRRPVLWGALLVGAMAVGLEASQLIIASRGPEIQDVVVAELGVISGGICWFFPGFHRRPWMWTVAGVLAIFASALLEALYPYHFSGDHSRFNWVLFLPQYERTTFAALGAFIESAMVYFPIGFLLAYFHPYRRPQLAAALLAGGMSLAAEALQGFVPGRYSDVTNVLGAVLGALAGGVALTRGWPSYREYMARDDDAQV